MLFERDKVDKKYKWKVEDLFSSDDAWEELFFSVEEIIPTFSKYQNKLNDNDTIFDCLEQLTKTSVNLSKLYQYSMMRKDEDSRNSLYQGMNDRASMLYVNFSSSTSFIVPELSELSNEKLESLAKSKKFSDYSVMFANIIKDKAIILSKKEEKLLSEMSIFADNSYDVFHMFDDADIKWNSVKDENGNDIEMSHGNYSVLLQSPDQDVRKNAFESMFTSYKDMKNVLAANYSGNVKKDWFYAKIRGFKSALDYSMYCEDVPSTCYKKLLDAVGKGTKYVHDYISFRKEILNLDVINMYDLYCPIINEVDLKLSYEEAVKVVKNALKVMGNEYTTIFDNAIKSGWIDVFENKGKRSGAYSIGEYGTHPFVLLNYQETIHDIFTIAHEMGHAIHSYYSNSAQPPQKANYEIFVAEIASTCNEVLLLKYLLKTATGDLRKYLLSYYLDMFRTTLFRQTMFSEFEVFAHNMVENGEPLTADILSEEYYKLNKKYYGDEIEHNELIKYEWARIPHFYSSYYVYKYATGITAAVSIANNILKYGEEYFKKYKQFLSAGGSLKPLDIIRLADVDLEKDDPYEIVLKEFKDTLDELKGLN